MTKMEEMILKKGEVLPGNVLKVGTFLNHRIDCRFLYEVVDEVAEHFKPKKINKVLTIEASGIAIASFVALKLNVPMVFAKKSKTINLSGEMYTTQIHSYTHGNDYTAVVMKNVINNNDRVLIVDDFLANGAAVEGLCRLSDMAGAEVCGICAAIEKTFQGGGNKLRDMGYDVFSLAMIDEMNEDRIIFSDRNKLR